MILAPLGYKHLKAPHEAGSSTYIIQPVGRGKVSCSCEAVPVGYNRAADDVQTDAKLLELEEKDPPIKSRSDDTEWKIVMPKGRRSYGKREETTMVTFSRK
jgi:hypothetical protein